MKFNFDIAPVSQIRPRFARRGRFVATYDPPKVKAYKAQVAWLGKQQMAAAGQELFDGCLLVNMYFYRPIQKSISKAEHKRRTNGQSMPNVKPDADNYVKAFFDALNGIVWTDDAKITDFSAHKRYSEKPHIEMEVLKLG